MFGGFPYEADSDADVIITASAGPNSFGYTLVAGDFDGDGIDDLAVGAPDIEDFIGAIFEYNAILSSPLPDDNGKVYLYNGTSLTSGSLGLSEADADSVIYSNNTDLFGLSMVASDMNNDGKDDLWIAAPFFDSTHGRASLYIMH